MLGPRPSFAAWRRCCLVRRTRSRRAPENIFKTPMSFYDWVSNSRGDKLRTFISPPRNASGKVPFPSFVGWLSCDSVESPQGETDGLGALVLGLIDQSGRTVRTEKPGGERLYRGEEVQAEVVTMILNWAKEQLATGKSSGALQPGPRSLLGRRGLAGFE